MEFIVARNPDRQSKLPYLLYLPLEGGVWLKAKETWPRAARVYCHPAQAPAPWQLEILERVVTVACERRGTAIDLLLARGNNKRSQFVYTTFRGRMMILWQTPKVATTSRPGVRIPFARGTPIAEILIDTRERYGYKFSAHGINVVRRALPAGDYAAQADGTVVAAVERKTLDDFVKSLCDGTLNYAAAELAQLRACAIVVEGTYSALLRHQYTRPGYLADLVARMHLRYPSVPLVFLESRKVAEEWTFRFLNAAQKEYASAPLLSAMIAPPLAPSPAESMQEKPKRRTRKKRPPSTGSG